MVEAEQQALKKGKSRKEAIYAAYDRFYKGDIAKEFIKASTRKRKTVVRNISKRQERRGLRLTRSYYLMRTRF